MLSHSRVWLFATPWIIARQALLFMEFPRQKYWIRLPFPASGDLPDPETEPVLLESPAMAGGFFTTAPTRKPPTLRHYANFVPLSQEDMNKDF